MRPGTFDQACADGAQYRRGIAERSAGAILPSPLLLRGRVAIVEQNNSMTGSLHPAAPHHLPAFITGPGETDYLMIGTAVFLVAAVLMVGNIFLRLHTLPERLAHKSQKLQFEIVAVLGLLALFTHIHAFWVAGLLLALVDLPDFGTPLRRISRSLETMAGIRTEEDAADAWERAGAEAVAHGHSADVHAIRCAEEPPIAARVDGPEKSGARSSTHHELTDA